MRLLSAILLLALSASLQAQDFVGTWSGPLAFPGGTLEFVLHIESDTDGYTATADSPLQNAYGIPVSVTIDGETVTATLPDVEAEFVGVREGDALVGTFSQGGFDIPATLTASTPAPNAELAAIVGDWSGSIAGMLPVILHLQAGSDPDRLAASLDSPSQEAFGIPTDGATLLDGALSIVVPTIDGQYVGQQEGDRFVGTWSQNGQNLPLVLTRVENSPDSDDTE